ncbi:MAG: M28 family peptidase [Xanthomonadaceae bacterium]|nr:M28 family peptidase [Xanthomonadaceae bacterium]
MKIPTSLGFDGSFAKKLVEMQTKAGPRVLKSKAHQQTGDLIVGLLKQFKFQVVEQSEYRNIIGSINPENKNRILFTAHWDTRPWADQDTENKDKPGPGANDGGSGVAVLLEMARNLSLSQPKIGVDLIFWDAEDLGTSDKEDSYCLGSQYWTKNPHVKNYSAKFGVNLDMVGAAGARFPIEGYSLQMGKLAVEKVLAAASTAGTSAYFERRQGSYITDDHFYIMKALKIPMMDVIQLRSSGGFYEHWHTHQDTVDKISESTLQAVGNTMLAVIKGEDL